MFICCLFRFFEEEFYARVFLVEVLFKCGCLHCCIYYLCLEVVVIKI